MDYQFQENSKFASLAFNNVYTDLPAEEFQLSDGKTWIMPTVPLTDPGIWKEWLGSIHMELLSRANLVLFVEEPSDNPGILDGVHNRLAEELCGLLYMLHLHVGIESAADADLDLLCGSSVNGQLEIRKVSQIPQFYQSRGYARAPITRAWLEDSLVLRDGATAMETDETQSRRVIRGLNTLFKGLRETGQDRLHQFVRSMEALVLPDIGRTQRQFVGRCQTFTPANVDTRDLLSEAFNMRSDTEHLNPWDKSVVSYPPLHREAVCWQRTRQIEHLACDAYSRLLRNAELREHFRTEAAIEAFWKALPDDQRRELWGTPLDIAQEPLVLEYDQWGRAIP